MAGVFVNYRRYDTSGHAGRLYDRLVQAFGRGRVFMDLDIEPGVDFERAIRRQLDSCDAVVVLIGRQWLTIPDAAGRARLQDPRDWTRLEIQIALERDIPVVPVLVQGARMPSADELPAPLRSLATRHALELSDARWDYDVGRLITALAKWVQPAPGHAGDARGAGDDGAAREAGGGRGGEARPGAAGRRGLRRIDWPEFTMSAAIAFTWFWAVPLWMADAWESASEGAEEVLAVSVPALVCGYGTTFGILLPVYKALAGVPRVLLGPLPIAGAVLFAGLVAASAVLQPDGEGRFGAVLAGALALALCNLGPVLAAHLRAEPWSASQAAVRTLVASAAFGLGTKIARFGPDAPILGGLLYNGFALAPLVVALFGGLSAWRARQLDDFARSWVVVPLLAGAFLLGHGGVRGTVTDETGGVLPGTTVEYGLCETYTGADGRFDVRNTCLPIYRQLFAPADVRFSLTGFTTTRVTTLVVPGVNRHLAISMRAGGAADAVAIASPFSVLTLLVLPVSALSVALPLMWVRWRKRGAPEAVAT